MNKKIMAVCDTELDYAKKLAGRISEEKGGLFQVQVYSDLEAVREGSRRLPIDVLLISEAAAGELGGLGISDICLLTEEDTDTCGGYKAFYKYQASSSLVREVLLSCGAGEAEYTAADVSERKVRGRVTGVFSPAHCSVKTLWAIEAGLILGERQPVLYMNLEQYTGFEALLGKQYNNDIVDIMFCLGREGKADKQKLEAMYGSYNGLSFIPPMKTAGAFDGISDNVIPSAVRRLISLYEQDNVNSMNFIIEFSGSTQGHMELLDICDTVFIICGKDIMALAGLTDFEKEAGHGVRGEAPEKLVKVCAGELKEAIGEDFIKENLEGKFGNSVKQELRKAGLID